LLIEGALLGCAWAGQRALMPDFASQRLQSQAVYQLVAGINELFERLVVELPAGTAFVQLRKVSVGTVIEVKPANPASVDFGVLADDFELYSLGIDRSWWDFPWERRYRNGEKDILTEVTEMARAVIAGNCEQTRGPFWLVGKIHVGEYTYKVTTLPKLPIPPFWTRKYAPYVVGSEVNNHCR
jgi:hypothetical protein